MADDLLELLKELHIDKFLLAGHSMGGKTAMKFALKWPEKLNGLVIVDISPYGSSSPDNPFFIEHKHILESLLSVKPDLIKTRTEIEDILSNQISSEKTRGFIMKNLKRRPEGNFEWKLNAPALLSNLPEITDGIIDREQGNLTITGFPVVFVRGGNSDYITNEDISLILKIFPATEIITIPETGHWIHAERPEKIAGIFLDLKAGN
jgi:pimeloyl-ACP methyl ester carboxylesterase